MKLSIHSVIRGKPSMVQDLNGHNYMESCGQRVNLGYGWMNIDLPWPDVFELITVDGCATSAELVSDHRNDENFVSRELLMVDIDSGMTIPELFDNAFYNEFGAGFYTTPSHTMDNHRFRIMFRTETPIQDSERVKLVIMALMRVFDHADVACKDSTRIFYGTPNCEFKEYTTKVLPNALVDQLIEMELAFRAEQQIETTQFDPRDYEPKTIEQITELLNDLRKYYTDLTHDPRMSVTWAVMSAGISATDTIALMRQRWPDTDKTRKYETIVNGHKNNAITLGTIYHMIRQHEPDYGRKTNLTPTAFDANTGAKIYTGITAMNLLRQDKFKMKGIIRNG